jgi:hypothetical protein
MIVASMLARRIRPASVIGRRIWSMAIVVWRRSLRAFRPRARVLVGEMVLDDALGAAMA